MARQTPKLLYTRDEWAQVPPEARLEVSNRRFTYLVQAPSDVERARGVRERRVLYEVELVPEPVPGHGLVRRGDG
jgi:hypothetical protein